MSHSGWAAARALAARSMERRAARSYRSRSPGMRPWVARMSAPPVALVAERGGEPVKGVPGQRWERPRNGAGVDDLHVAPREVALGLAAVGGDEDQVDGAGGVVDGGDGADVVPVERLGGDADGGVVCGVGDAVDSLGRTGRVGADGAGGVVFDPASGGGSLLEVGEVDGRGEGGDPFGVGVDDEGEVLGP